MPSEELLELDQTITPSQREPRPLDPPGGGRLLEFLREVTPEWRERAACRSVNPRWFFVEKGEQYVIAARTCASCPVIGECREYVLGLPAHTPGYWAGMTERDRRRFRAQAA